MPPPRAFDYDLLVQLLKEHPDWPLQDIADALTADNRKADPGARPVNVATVRARMHRLRFEGEEIPLHSKRFADFMPPPGLVHRDHVMAQPLRYLREISKERRGDRPVGPDESKLRGMALSWEHNLLLMGFIADLDANGVPFTRPAEPAELDEDGKPAALAAWLLPGWREEPNGETASAEVPRQGQVAAPKSA
jgi:hypothetical protein